MKPKRLKRIFYARPTIDVASELLGKIVVFERRGCRTAGRIVEVEAYLGRDDPASHAFRGVTPRNSPMFGPPGHAYVYFTYGNHFCLNVVTERNGTAGAVLIRALEPLEGIGLMKRRRKTQNLKALTSGPGRLTQALGITRRENNANLIRSPLALFDDGWTGGSWTQTPRIGISSGIDLPYRYVVEGSPFISRRLVSRIV